MLERGQQPSAGGGTHELQEPAPHQLVLSFAENGVDAADGRERPDGRRKAALLDSVDEPLFQAIKVLWNGRVRAAGGADADAGERSLGGEIDACRDDVGALL